LHAPYFELYRQQVVKQADLVLALYLRGDAFTDEQKAADFAYYEALTVRDSSLSAPVQAIVAAEVGHLDLAYAYFAESALMDLGDLGNNTRDGLHIASLAGTWLVAVAGFGGMRDHDDELAFAPRLPAQLDRLTFRLCYRKSCIRVEVHADHAVYELLAGPAVTIRCHGERVELLPEERVVRAISSPPRRTAPTQPPGRAPRPRP
jgi:alpha,alpha-trehalose phosphorylase